MDAICWRCHGPVTVLQNSERYVVQPCDTCIDQAFEMGSQQGFEECQEKAQTIVQEAFEKLKDKIR